MIIVDVNAKISSHILRKRINLPLFTTVCENTWLNLSQRICFYNQWNAHLIRKRNPIQAPVPRVSLAFRSSD